MRFWSHLFGRISIVVMSVIAATVTVSAKERLVMSYQCDMTGNSLKLTQSAEPISYAILGPRDQRPYTACVAAEGPDCRTVMVHQFEMSCAGHRVSWINVAAAMRDFHESAPTLEGGQLKMILVARRRGSEKLPWQNGPDRARVALPRGYAPVGEIGARFVLPTTTGKVVVSPDSTSVDAYASNTEEAQVYQVAAGRADVNNFQADMTIDDDAFAYAKDDRSRDIETAAVSRKHTSSWTTVVMTGETAAAVSSEGPGGAFMGYVMFAGVLASLVLVGGFSLRRHLIPVSSLIERYGSQLGSRTTSRRGKVFRAVMPEAPIPGIRVEMPNYRARQPIAHGQWQPGKNSNSWAALSGHSMRSAGHALKAIYVTAWQSLEQAKVKAFSTTASAKQAPFDSGRAQQQSKSHRQNHYQAPPRQDRGFDFNTAGFGRSASGSSGTGQAGTYSAYSERDVQFQSGLNVVDVGLRYSEEAVSALGPATQLRDVLTGELKILRQRQSVLRATIADGTATPSRAEATMRRLTVELERIRRIADSAAQSHGHGSNVGVQVPQTPAEAYDLLGVNADVTDAALKKIVDGLRMSWHPDMARDVQDRDIREARTKQLNIAWDLIQGRRQAQF